MPRVALAWRRRPSRRLARVLAMAATIATVSLLVGLAPDISRISFSALHMGTLVVSTSFFLLWVAADSRIGMWSPSVAYLSVFWVFHFGVVALAALSVLPSNSLTVYAAGWLYSGSGHTAVFLSLVAFVSVIAGAGLGRVTFTRRAEPRHRRSDERLGSLAGVAGTGLLVACFTLWVGLLVSRGGVPILGGSYREYLQVTEGFGWALGMLWLACGWGLVLVASAPKSRVRTTGLAVFALLGVTAFLMGLRGQVLFPLVAASVARAKGGKFLSLRQTVVVAVLLLFAISAVRTLRVSGISRVSDAEISFSMVEGLQELGMSLRPVERAVSWRETGDPLRLGESYWAPVDRALVHVLPDWRRPPAGTDERLLNVLTLNRVGPIGFSPVAEAYLNFGLAGVLFAMGLLGYVLGRFDTLPPVIGSQLVVGIMMIPLLVNVRNSFAEIPARLVLSALFLVLLSTLAKGFGQRRSYRHELPVASGPA